MQIFGVRLRKARKIKDITLTELSKRVGMSLPMVHLYEKGKYMPRIDTLMKFCAALDVSPNYLLGISNKHKDE